jgi:hypothetical protein
MVLGCKAHFLKCHNPRFYLLYWRPNKFSCDMVFIECLVEIEFVLETASIHERGSMLNFFPRLFKQNSTFRAG